MKISDCMKRNVIFAKSNISVFDAARIMIQKHIGTLPIVDEDSHLIGLVRIHDLISLAMPGLVQLIENADFINDFGALENDQPEREILNKPVSQVMCEPVCVDSSAGLLRAITLLQEHKVSDLPVVDEDIRLVGIASQVDIGIAILSNWNIVNS